MSASRDEYSLNIPLSENEPFIRRLLHYYTSWSFMEDEEGLSIYFDASFVVDSTPNCSNFSGSYFGTNAVEYRRWKRPRRGNVLEYLHEPSRGPGGINVRFGSSPLDILPHLNNNRCYRRLLSSADPRTLLAGLILILNCIDGSRTRMYVVHSDSFKKSNLPFPEKC